MTASNLDGVIEQILQRAQRQGYVVPREVRAELTQACLPESQWKDVVARAQHLLRYHRGRYYYRHADGTHGPDGPSRLTSIQQAVLALLEQHGLNTNPVERRGQGRIDFVQPVKVITEDNRELTLLSRDLSTSGIRLFGTRRLLGQKIRVVFSTPKGGSLALPVRILWTCPVGDDLVENGGAFFSEAHPEVCTAEGPSTAAQPGPA